MSTYQIVALVGICVAFVAAYIILNKPRHPKPAPNDAYAIIDRVATEDENGPDTIEFDTTLWPNNWPHDAPDEPFSLTEAHQAMQMHIDCHIDHCPRKRTAWATLVEHEHIRPDSSRTA